jgi:polyhydroxyalkanoate synthesis repressor PhaR
MSEPRIIKKYPNRRLYDTEVSSYITLEDVRKLVLAEEMITIIDARTHEDISHNTLLQIIIEQEEKGPSLFSTQSLQKLIHFYSSGLQSQLGKLFEQEMNFFAEQQDLMLQKGADLIPVHVTEETTAITNEEEIKAC